MKFNIFISKPPNDQASLAYYEIAELLHFSLKELGHQSCISINWFDSSARNIIFGYIFIAADLIENLPIDTVIFNTEPIYDNNASPIWRRKLLLWASRYEIWDYSDINFNFLSRCGVINKKLFKFGYQKELSRIYKSQPQDIDILFYGSMNDRRLTILDALKAEGCKVQYLNGCYGAQRDEFIARAKIILNVYYYNTMTFDIIRLFYLMSNSKAVVTEVDKDFPIPDNYKNGVCGSSYEKIVQACLDLIKDDASRFELEKNALLTMQSIPQKNFTEKLLNSVMD